jgi:hypothetical protein
VLPGGLYFVDRNKTENGGRVKGRLTAKFTKKAQRTQRRNPENCNFVDSAKNSASFAVNVGSITSNID